MPQMGNPINMFKMEILLKVLTPPDIHYVSISNSYILRVRMKWGKALGNGKGHWLSPPLILNEREIFSHKSPYVQIPS